LKTIALALLTAVSLTSHAQEEACKPNYEVTRIPCKATAQVTGYRPQDVTVRANPAACDPPVQRLCEEYSKNQIAGSIPGVDPDTVTLKSTGTKPTVGKFCGDLGDFVSSLGKSEKPPVKVSVWCTFEVQVPVYEMVVDSTCPINGVKDKSACYDSGKKTVNIDSSSIDDCLSVQPQDNEQLWTKAACLADAFAAQNSFRVNPDLSGPIYNRIKVQLEAVQENPQYSPALGQYLGTRINNH
jgi:hypothetical protein